MIEPRPSQRLRARTVELPETPSLLDLFPADGAAWIRRGQGMIGIGEVARLEGADVTSAEAWWTQLSASIEAESELDDHAGSGPIAFASFPFDPDNTSARSVVLVPRIVVGNRGGRSWLTMITETDQPWPEPPGTQPDPSVPHQARVVGGSMSRQAWNGIVAEVVSRIGALDGLEKVVLARSEVLRTDEPLDPRWLVSELVREYPNCWTFHVAGLIGASPEMLLRRERGLATSRVLAGTIRRNGNEELDLILAHALARSSKNLIEHELAVESVAHALEPFCSGMNVPDAPYVLELPNVLHLASDVTAVAHAGVSALRLAGELHPSAAVCGTPTDRARATIAKLENLDRRRYSGPVGWLDTRGDGEFAIALRCGCLDPNDPRQLTVYAGCGIVAESEPDEEYAETQAKLLPMHQVVGLNESPH